ncbi:endonuclease domain-containing protein [Kineococcus sp. SYSU DK003]|uniref:endonuclease domain-containing protein n=1 Tax=Kineococcus sp. SYSU DK003 TaxID=3383124 RepID=UPI003D7F0FF2
MQRVLRGVYSRPGLPLTHELRCEAAGLLLPPGAVVTGRSQATVLGVELARWQDDVEVLMPARGRWSTPGGITARLATRIDQGGVWRTTSLATRERMAFDVCTRLPLPEAVANLDAVVRGRLVDLGSFRRWVAESHDPHVAAAREAAALADPRAESRPESMVRVLLHRAGIPVEPRYHVHDASGGFVARLDLALVRFKVAVEYDGSWHALREQLQRDRHRLRALRDLDWEVVHVTADMLGDPQSIVHAVERAIARQGAVLSLA